MTQYNSPKNKRKDNNPYLAFLHSLEKYQDKTKTLDYNNCIHLKQIIQHYYDTHYQYYYGSTIPYYSNFPSLPSSDDMTDSHIQTSVEAAEADTQKTYNNSPTNAYLEWQQKHEVDLHTTSSPVKLKVYRNSGIHKKSQQPPKEKVTIDIELESTDDLLQLLNQHSYDPTKEYNIDLKALHKIKTEIEQLNAMVGLKSVKTSILRQLMYFMQGFTDDPVDSDYKHTVFTGPPGTGKTEMAKLLGTMYSKIGILKNNVFKKVTRTDLVAGYLGQTAIKTQKVLDECAGGVLFLDEAYSLQSDDMYAKECVDTLCEALSDRKQNLMVIIAGYTKELESTFFSINSGLKSRFLWRFDIEPYTVEELYEIFQYLSNTRKWILDSSISKNWFESKKSQFQDNGRSMEQLFSYSKIAHAQRIYGKDPALRKTLTQEDLDKGFVLYEEYGHVKKEKNLYYGLYT